MNATVHAARIDQQDGPSFLLSLHTSQEGAIAAILARGAELWEEWFGYVPRELEPLAPAVLAANGGIALQRAADRLATEGWNARVEELPVHLDDPNPPSYSTRERGRA